MKRELAIICEILSTCSNLPNMYVISNFYNIISMYVDLPEHGKSNLTYPQMCDFLFNFLKNYNDKLTKKIKHGVTILLNIIYDNLPIHEDTVKWDVYIRKQKILRKGQMLYELPCFPSEIFPHMHEYIKENISHIIRVDRDFINLHAKYEKHDLIPLLYDSFKKNEYFRVAFFAHNIPWCEHTPILLKQTSRRRIMAFMCATRQYIVKNIRNKIIHDYYTQIY
jgi:hypothetical protein